MEYVKKSNWIKLHSYIHIDVSTRCKICNIHIRYRDILQVCSITTSLYQYTIEVCDDCMHIEWASYEEDKLSDRDEQEIFEDDITITANTEEIV